MLDHLTENKKVMGLQWGLVKIERPACLRDIDTTFALLLVPQRHSIDIDRQLGSQLGGQTKDISCGLQEDQLNGHRLQGTMMTCSSQLELELTATERTLGRKTHCLDFMSLSFVQSITMRRTNRKQSPNPYFPRLQMADLIHLIDLGSIMVMLVNV